MIYENLLPSSIRVAFTDKVRVIASKFGFNPEWLMIVMRFETGGKFNTGSHGNGAYGLIGFRATVAKELGTTVESLSNMTPVQQLDYVDKYLTKWNAKAKVRDLTDLYMIVFSPAYAGKPDSYVLYRSGTQGYAANYKAFDPTGKGYFTIGDIGKVIARFAGTVNTGSTSFLLSLLLVSAVFVVVKSII